MIDQKKFQMSGVTFSNNDRKMEFVTVANESATAKFSTTGAHILSYIPEGEKDLLWVSKCSDFVPGKPIRGGIPVCWPWFGAGPKEGYPSHGFARRAEWELSEITHLEPGTTRVVFTLDSSKGVFPQSDFPFFATMTFMVGKCLEITLMMVNKGEKTVQIGAALHTYFAVSNCRKVAVTGLDNIPYSDNTARAAQKEGNIQRGDLGFSGEVDYEFYPAPGTAEIVDPGYGRVITVEKSGSLSTVVWNPWIEKSKAMPDYGDEEYPEMICVECANARHDLRELKPGIPHQITQKISVR